MSMFPATSFTAMMPELRQLRDARELDEIGGQYHAPPRYLYMANLPGLSAEKSRWMELTKFEYPMENASARNNLLQK